MAKIAMGTWVGMVALPALAFPPASAAGTAQVFNNTLSFEARAGETNRLTVTHEDLGSFEARFTFEDLGAPVTAGLGCRAISSNRVSCEGDFQNIEFDVGDLADSVTMPRLYGPSGGGPSVTPCCVVLPERLRPTVLGGAGDDVLKGGHAIGGSSRDGPLESLQGGPGNDRITSGDYAGDGGPGLDTELIGGQGDDELRCAGGLGSFCSFQGGEGVDSLIGGASTEAFLAGPGDDTVQSKDETEENVDCGEGTDRFESDPIDRVANCETPFSESSGDSPSTPSALLPSAHGSRQRDSIVSVISGRLGGSGEAQCSGRARISLRAGRKLLVRRDARLRPECLYSRRLSFPVGRLPRRQRSRLGRNRPVVISATVHYLGNGQLPPDRSPTRRYRVRP
jgi:hypothetical protein